MSRFTAPLVVTPTPDYRSWVVLYSSTKDGTQWAHGGLWSTPFGYDIGEEGSGISIVVQRDFVTDFASVPWFARWLIKTWGRYTNPAVIHDYLYRGGEIMNAAPDGSIVWRSRYTKAQHIWPKMTRRGADGIMLEAMKVMSVPSWQRYLIYAGVRIGGWRGWRRHHARS